MQTTKLLSLAAALIVALLLTTATAHAVSRTPKAYAFTVTSVELRDAWSDQSRRYPDRCESWIKGSGLIRQTAQETGSNIELDWIGGAWLTIGREFKTRGTFERTIDYRGHVMPNQRPCTPCGPLSEYGPCRPVVPDEHVRNTCGPRDGSFEMHLASDGPKMTLFAGMGSLDHIERCPEIDANWITDGPYSPDYGPVSVAGGTSRLLRMAVGDRRTLRFAGRRGRCSRLGRRGAHVCSSIAATIVFKRTA